MSDNKEARSFLAEALLIEESDIPDDPSPETMDAWDSLSHTEIVMALEDRLGRELDAAEIAGIESLADIQAILVKG